MKPVRIFQIYFVSSLMLLILLCLIGCNGTGQPGPDPLPPPPLDGEVDTVIDELLHLHNAARQIDVDQKLHLEDRCLMAAKHHANWMAQNGKMAHTGVDGRGPSDRLRREGYPVVLVGENIAWGYKTPEAVFEGWMNSSGHRRNILNGAYQHVGLAYADSPKGRYWCAIFANFIAVPRGDVGDEDSSPEGIISSGRQTKENRR